MKFTRTSTNGISFLYEGSPVSCLFPIRTGNVMILEISPIRDLMMIGDIIIFALMMLAQTLVAQVLAVLLVLSTSTGHINSKSHPRTLTFADGFNDFVAEEEDGSYISTTTLSAPNNNNNNNATATTTHQSYDKQEVGSMGGIPGILRGTKWSNKKKKGTKSTFDLPLTVFGSPDNVLVTPVYIAEEDDDKKNNNKEKSKVPLFVGFDVTATNSWIYPVDENTGGEQAAMSGSLELGSKHHTIDDFQFLRADTKVHPSFANSEASFFDGLLGLGITSKKNMLGTALFHRMAGGRNNAPGVLKKPAVAFYVSPSGQTGEITFGGHKKSHLATEKKKKAEMFYIPVVPPTPSLPDWTLRCHCLSVGPNNDGGNPIMEDFNAVFMTTVNHAFMTNSRKRFKALAKSFGDKAKVLTKGEFKDDYQLIVDCDARDKLPALQLKIKTTFYKEVYSFTGMEVFPREITGNPKYEGKCASFFKLTDFKEYGLPASKDFEWAIGTDFMKKYYVEFSLKNKKKKRSSEAGSDVDGYIAIGRSIGIELEYEGPERMTTPPAVVEEECPHPLNNVVAEVGPGPNEISISIEEPCHNGESAEENSPDHAGSADGCGGDKDGGGGESVTSTIVGRIGENGEIDILGGGEGGGGQQQILPPPATPAPPAATTKSRKWRRWVVAGGIAACGIAVASDLMGGQISNDGKYAAVYFGAGGGMLVGTVGDDNLIDFRETPPPDAARAFGLFGGLCKQIVDGTTWKIDCSEDWGL